MEYRFLFSFFSFSFCFNCDDSQLKDVERKKSIRDSPSDFLFLFMRRANQVAYLFSLRVLRIEFALESLLNLHFVISFLHRFV